MAEIKGAARKTDLVNHGQMRAEATGKIAAAAVDIAWTAYTVYRVAKIGMLAAPGVGWGAWLISTGVELAIAWGVSYVVENTVTAVVASGTTGHPEIKPGSPNVFTNQLNAARGGGKDESCCGGKVMEGSKWVSINKLPASRLDDNTTTGPIGKASTNVAIGGPPAEEFNPLGTLEWILFGLGLYGAAKVGAVTALAQKTSLVKTMAEELGKFGAGQLATPYADKAADAGVDTAKGYLPW